MSISNTNQLDMTTYKSSIDYLGATSSTLCAVHCLLTPLLFAVQASSLSCSAISPTWWKLIDILFLLISFIAVIFTAKNTSLKHMPRLLYISWTVLAIIVLNNIVHLVHIPHVLIYIPAIALVILHLYNKKYCTCNEDSCCVSH